MTEFETVLANLKQNGISNVAPGLSRTEAEALRLTLRQRGVFNAHVRVYSDDVPYPFLHAEQNFPVWCHGMPDVMLAPHFFDLALKWTPLAEAYLGQEPRLYSFNAFWSRPSQEDPIHDLQTFHRDKDDTKFLALFMYGTDVLTDNDGPHCYMVGTHDDEEKLPFHEHRILGPAGTTFLADTRGLHLGLKPKRGSRLILWARWGVSEKPWAYENDKLAPMNKEMLGLRSFGEKQLRILQLVVK